MAHSRDRAERLRLPSRRLKCPPNGVFNLIVDAAVVHWSMDTRQAELREALDKVLEHRGDTTLNRALELRWRKRPRPLVRAFE
jgi:hypothetical protein